MNILNFSDFCTTLLDCGFSMGGGNDKGIFAVVPFGWEEQIGGFSKEDNSKFGRAIVELQMRMFITMCGRQQKTNKYGEGYDWSSTVFTTTEDFWNKRNFQISNVDKQESIDKITKQILKLNPNADMKKISKFIKG